MFGFFQKCKDVAVNTVNTVVDAVQNNPRTTVTVAASVVQCLLNIYWVWSSSIPLAGETPPPEGETPGQLAGKAFYVIAMAMLSGSVGSTGGYINDKLHKKFTPKNEPSSKFTIAMGVSGLGLAALNNYWAFIQPLAGSGQNNPWAKAAFLFFQGATSVVQTANLGNACDYLGAELEPREETRPLFTLNNA